MGNSNSLSNSPSNLSLDQSNNMKSMHQNKSQGSADIHRLEIPMQFLSSKQTGDLSKSSRSSPKSSPDAPTAKKLKRRKSTTDKLIIKASLSTHFLFSSLSEENIDKIIENMHLLSLEPNEVVFSQGNPGKTFFVIARGSVEIIINGVKKGVLGPGQGFGELALIHDIDRTATIKTITKTQLWGIERVLFREILKTLSSMKFEENKEFLRRIPFLAPLTDAQIEQLVTEAVNHTFTHGHHIVNEGDPGGSFYIIKEGVVECSVQGKVYRRLGVGEYFGEQVLISSSMRCATVTAVNKVKLLSFGKDFSNNIQSEEMQLFFYKNTLRFSFDRCQVLSKLNRTQEENLIRKFKIFDFTEGQVVIPKGPVKGRYLWIVLKGSIFNGRETFERFHVIGTDWMINSEDELNEENFIALTEVDMGIIKVDALEAELGGKLSQVIKTNEIFSSFQQVYMFRILSENKLLSICSKVRSCCFEDGEFIFKQGDNADGFYFIKQGEVDILKDSKVIRTIVTGNFFGERSIVKKESRTASVVCKRHTEVWFLAKDDFLSIVDESILELLLQRIQLQDDSIRFDELVMADTLGKGTFGSVYLCVNKRTGVFYALKVFSRKKIEAYDIYNNLILEKQILERVEHQFVVKYVKTFKDESRIYILLEFIQGKTFYEVLRILNVVNMPKCKFYSCCLLLILEHLHSKGIIYRDLKPENIIVDKDGYLKLLDFGTAKILDKCKDNRTYTVIGTPHYMAPEVILGKGYSFSADFWSLGVLIYEMLCGTLPFGKDSEDDPYTIYREVISGKFDYPSFINSECQEIMNDLLNSNISKRSSSEKIKDHKWLVDVNWDNILSRKKSSPYKPTTINLEDLANESIETGKYISDYLKQIRESSGLIGYLNKGHISRPSWDKEF